MTLPLAIPVPRRAAARLSTIAAALAGISLGCDAAQLVSLEARLSAPDSVDLGRTSLGVEVERVFEIEAIGDLPVRIDGIEVVPADAPITVLSFPKLLPTGARDEVRLVYRPVVEGPLQASLRIAANTDDQVGARVVALTAEAVFEGLEIQPSPLDFGAVRLADARNLRARITNRLSGPVRLALPLDERGEPVVDTPTGVFRVISLLGPGGRIGNGELAPGDHVELELGFAPRRTGEVFGGVEIRFCNQPLCAQRLELVGRGVEVGLRCRPAVLDFGFVDPSARPIESVECKNPTHRPLDLGTPTLTGSEAERFTGSFAPVRVPPGGQADFPLTLSPIETDRGRTLRARFTIQGQPTTGPPEWAEVELVARVARAELAVFPPRLDLGEIAVGLDARREVVIANIGDRPITMTSAAAGPPPWLGGEGRRVLGPGDTLSVEVSVLASVEGPIEGRLRFEVDDPEVASIEVPLTALGVLLPPCRVRIEPRQINFGVTPFPSATRRSVVVSNDAEFDCLVGDPQVEGDAFEAISRPGSRRLRPGENTRFEAVFRPGRAGEHRGQLIVRVSDLVNPERAVPLSGIAGEGDLRVDPNRLDFGQVRPGCSTSVRELRLSNLGSSPLDVGRVFSTSPAFVIEGAPDGLPAPPGTGATIPGGGSLRMQVRFQPDQLGEAAPAVVRVEEAGALAPQLVDLVGRAANGPVTERFHQQPASAVDVLFVIDNSPSMEREQASVIANTARFLARLVSAGADYRVAVISTDVAANECAAPGPVRPVGAPQGACGWFADGDDRGSDPAWRVIDPTDRPSPGEAFARIANLGLSGSAVEAGLAAALRAFRPALLRGHNQGFLRPQAALSIVFISDEEDNSPLEIDAYVAAFRALKGAGQPERLSASAVITTGVECAIESGARFRAVAEALGGIVRPICSSDWAGVVSDLADRALGLRDRFTLGQPPTPGTLTVQVDGRPVPEASGGRTQWRFDPASRSLVFEAEARPAAGTSIEVSYVPACL